MKDKKGKEKEKEEWGRQGSRGKANLVCHHNLMNAFFVSFKHTYMLVM
jgi:hypothetical protein